MPALTRAVLSRSPPYGHPPMVASLSFREAKAHAGEDRSQRGLLRADNQVDTQSDDWSQGNLIYLHGVRSRTTRQTTQRRIYTGIQCSRHSPQNTVFHVTDMTCRDMADMLSSVHTVQWISAVSRRIYASHRTSVNGVHNSSNNIEGLFPPLHVKF